MKTGTSVESRTDSGFWARLANAFAAVDTTATNLLESRVARLEKQVAQLIGAGERAGANAPRKNDAA